MSFVDSLYNITLKYIQRHKYTDLSRTGLMLWLCEDCLKQRFGNCFLKGEDKLKHLREGDFKNYNIHLCCLHKQCNDEMIEWGMMYSCDKCKNTMNHATVLNTCYICSQKDNNSDILCDVCLFSCEICYEYDFCVDHSKIELKEITYESNKLKVCNDCIHLADDTDNEVDI